VIERSAPNLQGALSQVIIFIKSCGGIPMRKVVLGAILFVSISGPAWAENLNRDRASSVISSYLSDPKYGLIQRQINLSFFGSSFQFFACAHNDVNNKMYDLAACSAQEALYKHNADYKKEIDEQVSLRLAELVKMSDEEFRKAVTPPRLISCGQLSQMHALGTQPCETRPHKVNELPVSVYGKPVLVRIALEQLDNYRQVVQAHVVKEFNWSLDNQHNGNDTGIIDDGVRPFCPNYRDGDRFCSLIVATRKLKGVTGIIGSENIRQVEFQTELAPTEIGQRLFNQTPQMENHIAQFVLYDDGWRMSNWN
jgi:hypothetical protein